MSNLLELRQEIRRSKGVTFNSPEAIRLCVNKQAALEAIRKAGVRVPKTKETGLPCVVKPPHHQGGRGIKVIERASDLVGYDRRGYYMEEFVPSVKEYRVHVVGSFTCARLKTGGKGPIRSRRYGYKFMYDPQAPGSVREAGKRAVQALGLDCGAVDVGVMADGKPVVYEVNSNPCLRAEPIIAWYKKTLGILGQRRSERA